jgi:hypothetical protein
MAGHTPVVGAAVPLTVTPASGRARSIAALLDQAALDIPQMAQDGVQTSVQIDGRGVSVQAQVQVKDFSGAVVATRRYDGQKEVAGAISWRFDW